MTDLLPALALAVGRVIVGVRRVFYVLQQSVDESVGALELTFGDGAAILMDSGSDGETLAVATSPWTDPFSVDVMSSENLDFVERSGKWTVFDVSDRADYAMLVGATVEQIAPISSGSGKVIGVTISTSAGNVRVEVEADDLRVQRV